jgi:uncharacterized protein YndB with AHSA1/START domain
MKTLPHQLTRTLLIQAKPEIVFNFFTDSTRWARWWGTGSTIDASPGGRVTIRHPNGVEVLGEVLEIVPPERIVFTYGYENGKPIPLGGSRVTIRLQPHESGTQLSLLHEFDDAAVRNDFVQGWRFQLSLFANVVANEANANAAAVVDRWYAAWSIPDDPDREKELRQFVSANVRWHDPYSSIEGVAELVPHIGAAQRFMPRVTMKRVGDVRHCQGMVLSQWAAMNSEGQKVMEGSNVFVFDANGRIESATGFPN